MSLILTFGEFIDGISGEIGLNFTDSGNVTAFATFPIIFKGVLFTFLGLIPAFIDISTGGSRASLVLAIP